MAGIEKKTDNIPSQLESLQPGIKGLTTKGQLYSNIIPSRNLIELNESVGLQTDLWFS